MVIEAKLFEETITSKNESEYIFIDLEGNQFKIKNTYIFSEPYTSCNALLKKSKVPGEYVALIK